MATAGALAFGGIVPRRGGGAAWRCGREGAVATHPYAGPIPQPDRVSGPATTGDRAREDDPCQHVRERGGGIAHRVGAHPRGLAKEQGGRPEAAIWFDGTRLRYRPPRASTRGLSDAAASDDSDIRNTAHEGTTLAAASLAVGERTAASGPGSARHGPGLRGRGADRRGASGRPRGLHASQIVAFAGAAAAATLLELSDAQMAHALGIVATTVGGLATGTNSWAREYMGPTPPLWRRCRTRRRRGYTVNEDMVGGAGGFVEVFGGGAGPARA